MAAALFVHGTGASGSEEGGDLCQRCNLFEISSSRWNAVYRDQAIPISICRTLHHP
jgi:hypothetical protein